MGMSGMVGDCTEGWERVGDNVKVGRELRRKGGRNYSPLVGNVLDYGHINKEGG